MLNEPLTNVDARTLIRKIVASGAVQISPHARKRMVERQMTDADVVFVLRSGFVSGSEYENGSWRYRVCASRMVAVVAFRAEDHAIVVTVINDK